MKKRVNIGFDVGIASVGWALVDEENNIIDRGVRTFDELKNPKDGKLLNQERRAKRTLRRIIRRKQRRKLDFINLVANKYYKLFDLQEQSIDERKKEINLILTNPLFNDVLSLKMKAIKHEIDKKELLKILYNYLSHRGFTYLDLEKYEKRTLQIKKISDNESFKKIANWCLTKDWKVDEKEIRLESEKINYKDDFVSIKQFESAIKTYNRDKYLIENFPTQLQYEEFKKNNEYRGVGSINDKFFIQDWKREIEHILNNQSYLTQEFKDEYLYNKNSLFLRLRDFSDGPGVGSEYGLYEKDENGFYTKESNHFSNLWDKLLGKCSVYPNEYRADKKACSQEIANILSQINVLKINKSSRQNTNLTKDEKEKIIFESIKNNKIIDLKIIFNIVQCLPNEIVNYPTDVKKDNKNAKTKFDEISNSRKLFEIFKNQKNISNFSDFKSHLDFFNKIISIFSKNPDNKEKQEKKLVEELKINIIDAQEIAKIDVSGKSTSSMSLKALNEYIDNEINDGGKSLNQKFKSIIDKNQENAFDIDVSQSKYINEKCLDSEIMSPTTKCSFRETLKVLNAILKKYIYNGDFYIKNIVLEMPTEWNSVDERKSIKEKQNANEKNRIKIKEQYPGNDSTIINKLLLLQSQDGKDIYSGQSLDVESIINDPSYCDIDHIIPYSISFDNSLNNKVLTLNKLNKEKGKRTPHQYLEKGKYFSLKDGLWNQLYKNNENKDLNNVKKYEYLTLENISETKNLGFIGRNLSDTRYACRAINSLIKTWVNKVSDNEKLKNLLSDIDINVINVNGKFSQRYRYEKFLNLGKKDRDDFSHHAIDATICAILGNTTYTIGKLVWYKEYKVDEETGEVIKSSKSEYKNIDEIEKLEKTFDNDIKWHDLSDNVKNAKVKFSHKLTKKNSFKLWGDSIISIKKIDNKYLQANKKDLLDIKDFSETQKFINSLKEEYVIDNKIVYSDPKLFKDVLSCYEEGIKLCNQKGLNDKNPFKVFMDEFNIINQIEKAPTKLAINRDGHIYYVKSLKTHKGINSFIPINKDVNDNHFGAFTGLEWKEIRLYKIQKGFKVIPIQASEINNKNNMVDEKLIEQKLILNNIDIDNKFFTIHKGQTLINKNDKNDLVRIVGGDFLKNKLEIKPIYKSNEKQNQVSINTILNNYDFCNIDILGNYWPIKLDL